MNLPSYASVKFKYAVVFVILVQPSEPSVPPVVASPGIWSPFKYCHCTVYNTLAAGIPSIHAVKSCPTSTGPSTVDAIFCDVTR